MPLRPALLLSLALALGACDTNDVEDTSLQVLVSDFEIDADDYSVEGLKTASFSAADAVVTRGNLSETLQTAGSGDMVMLYIASELVNQFETNPDELFWSALPLSRAVNSDVPVDDDGDGVADGTVPVIDYTVSYEYQFADRALFFDVVSSLPYTEFGDDPGVLFDFISPRLFGEAPDTLFFRLVVIPEELFFVDGAAARVDLRDYEAVKAAFGLPD